jgi:mycothiol system anti-sigma-R factor
MTDREGMDADHGGEHINCTEAVHVLYQFLDGELTEVRRVEIQTHLQACLPCWEAFDFEAEMKIFIAKRCRDTAPDALRDRVMRALGQDPERPEGMFST